MDRPTIPPTGSNACQPDDGRTRAATTGTSAAHSARYLPETIGRYRILGLLGEGGMGSVYQAEQQNPLRLVALKVIKAGIVTNQLLRRFEQEAEALGRLQHPGIAQVYEAGTADNGFGPQPYFAMEFIEGRPLVDYAAEQRLDVSARLELMAKVCDAVNHAHQRGIIHRDLKPGNILVDATGQPKVLDFGVARVTDSDAQATRQTDIGQLIGTLEYMSPEQALANPAELDLRSDVYTLGVILYQMLADKLPYNTVEAAIHEVIRVIREDDPAPLSSVHRGFRGDIETIVGKALEKDKARRYGTAAELAADIRRHLTDQPIAARPPSASYQMQKFARRHKALVAGVAAVFVVLLGGVIASALEAARARGAERSALAAQDTATRQRDRAVNAEQKATAAEQQAEKDRNRAQDSEAKALRDRNVAQEQTKRANTAAATSKAVSNFLQYDLLNQASAQSQSEKGFKVDPNLTVRTAMDRAAAGIGGKFDKQPEVEANIQNTIGATYINLGLPALAQKPFERSVELNRKALGNTDSNTLNSVGNLSVSLMMQSKFAEDETLLSRTLDALRGSLGAENPKTLEIAERLGSIYITQGKFAQAEALYTGTLASERRVLGAEDSKTLGTMGGLADIELYQHKYAAAETLFTQILEIQSRVRGPEHDDTLGTMESLADAYKEDRKYAQSEQLYDKILEIRRRVHGAEDLATLRCAAGLAGTYQAEGKYPQAEELLTKNLEIERRAIGPESNYALDGMDKLADLYRTERKNGKAEELLRQSVEIKRRVLGPEETETLQGMASLASLYLIEKKYAQAEELLTQTLEIRRRVLGAENVETINGMEDLASAYQAAKKYPEAEAMQTQSIELRRKVQGPENVETLRAMGALANIERAEGKYAPAEALLGQILEIRRRVLGPDHRDTLVTSVRLADSYYFQGNYAQASAVYSQSLESARRVLAPGDPLMLGILENLGSTLSHQGQYDEVDQLFREAILNTGPAQQQTLWYNFACAAAVAGRKDAALDYLSQAIDRGFDDADTMGHDDDLKSLRGDARFDALVARASRAAAAPQR